MGQNIVGEIGKETGAGDRHHFALPQAVQQMEERAADVVRRACAHQKHYGPATDVVANTACGKEGLGLIAARLEELEGATPRGRLLGNFLRGMQYAALQLFRRGKVEQCR